MSAFGIPNPTQQILAFLPQSFFALLEKLPSHSLKASRDVAEEGRITGNAMLEQRKNNNARESGKDVLSLLSKFIILQDWKTMTDLVRSSSPSKRIRST